MQSFNLNLRCFKKNTNNSNIKKNLNSLIQEKNEILSSLSKKYQDSFNKKLLLKFKKYTNIRIFGMGGSSLGTQAIHDFLNNSIKKKYLFLIIFSQKIKKKIIKKV